MVKMIKLHCKIEKELSKIARGVGLRGGIKSVLYVKIPTGTV